MNRYKGKHYWNYRIVTRIIKGQLGIDLSDPRNNKQFPDERVFSITEVYYNGDVPDSYIEPKEVGVLSDHISVEDLKWVIKKAKKALKKDILDLDNFPNVWCDGEQDK